MCVASRCLADGQTSTLDVDNQWLGKLSYSFTVPHKAHAAGADIPCHVRLIPHDKRIVITSLHTAIRESLCVGR